MVWAWQPTPLVVDAAGSVSITPADATHGHTADAPTVTPAYTFTPNEAAHGHAADAVTVTPAYTFAANETLHGHAADNVTVIYSPLLVIAEAVHAHAADAPTVTPAYTFTPNETTHAHAADAATVTPAYTFGPAEALHGHAADAVTVTPAYTFAPAEALHGHAADEALVSTSAGGNAGGDIATLAVAAVAAAASGASAASGALAMVGLSTPEPGAAGSAEAGGGLADVPPAVLPVEGTAEQALPDGNALGAIGDVSLLAPDAFADVPSMARPSGGGGTAPMFQRPFRPVSARTGGALRTVRIAPPDALAFGVVSVGTLVVLPVRRLSAPAAAAMGTAAPQVRGRRIIVRAIDAKARGEDGLIQARAEDDLMIEALTALLAA
jgi:hypothetical protein